MIINSVACVQKNSKKVSENRHMGVKGFCQFFSIGEIFYNIISEDYYDIFVSFYSYYFLWRIQQTPTNLDLQKFAAFI